jgi:peptide/nickel transport system substrate-binding protein
MFDRQSMETDQEKRKKLVWEIDRRLQGTAPARSCPTSTAEPAGHGGTCWHPRVHGVTIMTNSIFNGWRFDDAWLDQ